MPILDKSYFKPKSSNDIRKYYTQGFGQIRIKNSVKFIALHVGFYLTPSKFKMSGLWLTVPEESFRDLTVYELNEVQFEYAIDTFLKLVKGYEVYRNPDTEEKLIAKILSIANAIIDLRNWLSEHEGIPDYYYVVDDYLSRFHGPTVSSIDEMVSKSDAEKAESIEKFHWLDIENLRWENLILEFTSDDTLRIEIKDKKREYNFTQLNFHRKRNPIAKINSWALLKAFAVENGTLHPVDIKPVEKPISDLRSHLKKIFGIKSNPIIRKKKISTYETKFILRPNKNLHSEFLPGSEEIY